MNSRSRAEAFAKSLNWRLRHLGGIRDVCEVLVSDDQGSVSFAKDTTQSMHCAHDVLTNGSAHQDQDENEAADSETVKKCGCVANSEKSEVLVPPDEVLRSGENCDGRFCELTNEDEFSHVAEIGTTENEILQRSESSTADDKTQIKGGDLEEKARSTAKRLDRSKLLTLHPRILQGRIGTNEHFTDVLSDEICILKFSDKNVSEDSEDPLVTVAPPVIINENHQNGIQNENTNEIFISDISKNDENLCEKLSNISLLDNEENNERFIWKRSKSLKSGKTPPDTPCQKKIVRFADVFGLDLESVRTFLDEVPNVPMSAFSDLKDVNPKSNSSSSKYGRVLRASAVESVPTKTLLPMFQQPAGTYDFMNRVKNQKVCLENAVMVHDMVIKGTVRVLNLDFKKSVFIRYTMNEWKTYFDLYCSYIEGSCDGFSDKFQFSIYSAHYIEQGERLLFSICYQTLGQQFWDNNFNQNYCFQCFTSSAIRN